MKTIICISVFLQFGFLATVHLNAQVASTALSKTQEIATAAVLHTEANVTKDNSFRKKRNSKTTVPFPAFLSTMDNKNVSVLIQDVTDSAILIVSKSHKPNPDINGMEINYSNIREIKIRRKNGILKGVLFGVIAGALPVAGGAIVGQAQGGGFVSMVTLPAGIITGGLIGTSHKKYHINGNAASFSRFKTNVQ